MEPAEKAIRKRCRDNFPHYAKKALKIRTKKDGVQPLILNDAQQYIHEKAEQMLKTHGYVRIILLKGRQQGASTYIEGRFYWKVTQQKGVRAYILTHEGEATANLFDMSKRYHDKMHPLLKPSCDKDNGNELHFDLLDSGYKVGTAGSKDVGRSSTVQYFHGSEVAFWPNAQDHARGVMQAVPKGSGEVWLESTSDGIGNYFYDVWRLAESGSNDFLPVFVPWFWQQEYQIPVDDSFERDEDEHDYVQLVYDYHGYKLSDEQLNFRRDKIAGDFGGEVESFKREYPATPQEAFESAGIAQFIPGELATRACVGSATIEPFGAVVMGVDCARFGNDRTVIYRRQGRVAIKLETLFKKSQMEIVGYIKIELEKNHYDRVFIDVGMGVGVIDRLHEMGFDQVQAVDFGSKALDPKKYSNKRNEIYGELLVWLEDEPVMIVDGMEAAPAHETLSDLCSIHYKFDSKGRKVLEKKEDTKKRLGASPDSGDALAVTFAEPVAMSNEDDEDNYDGFDDSDRNSMGY